MRIKRGDDFELPGVYRDSSRVAVDLTGYTITSKVRKTTATGAPGDDVATLTVTIDSDQVANRGKVTISDPGGGTGSWPLGRHVWDCKVVNGLGRTVHTSTVEMIVDPEVT